MTYKISPDVFFLIEDGNVLLWNCLTHEQYLIDSSYFSKILELSRTGSCDDSGVRNELHNAGVIVGIDQIKKDAWGWDILSKLFHVGTRDTLTEYIDSDPMQYSRSYINESEVAIKDIPIFFQEKNTPIIDLPTPSLNLDDASFSSVLKTRKTSRSFNGEPITIQKLSDLLYASFGLIHGEWQELSDKGLKIAGIRKSSPASGGIHAEEAYVTVFNVDGLDPGVYYYRPQDHKLNVIRLGCFEEQVIQFNRKQFYSKGLSFGIYISARLDKYWWKYKHSRTYRIMLLDVGHISQTFLLAATALGLNTWLTGAFEDSEIEKFLNIHESNENVILFVGAGYGDSSAFPRSFYNS